MDLWHSTITAEERPSSINEVLASEEEGLKTYQRKVHYKEPQLMPALLNTPVRGIFANA